MLKVIKLLQGKKYCVRHLWARTQRLEKKAYDYKSDALPSELSGRDVFDDDILLSLNFTHFELLLFVYLNSGEFLRHYKTDFNEY